MSLEKVVSGGQRGVDQAALRAAKRAGLKLGGWCPPKFVCDSKSGLRLGKIPIALRIWLSETRSPSGSSRQAPKIPRSERTQWNVRNSDATLVLRYLDPDPDSTGIGTDWIDAGTAWTATSALAYGRPLLVCDPRRDGCATRIFDWLDALSVRILNVAGPSEKNAEGIGKISEDLLYRVFVAGEARRKLGENG